VYEEGKITYWKGQEGSEEVEPDAIVPILQMDPVLKMEIPIGFSNMQVWPLEPAKTPIVHFVNNYDPSTPNGESELRPAIPLQDALNRTMYSMIMASEFSAFNIKWSIGMEIDADGITPGAVVNLVLKDKEGNIITEISEEMAAFLSAVKVGQFESTDISQYLGQIELLVREISQNTQTPIYGVTAQGNLSGEALKQLEIGLIGKCERYQNQNADAVRELITLTAQIQNAFATDFGEAPVFEDVSITWKSPELLDATAQIATLVTMRTDAVGLWSDEFYRTKIGALLGMSTTEITQEGEIAKQESQNRLETLVGAGAETLPVV
jgi:hypothetical protein